MAIRINQWINTYQNMLHDSIMNKVIAMDRPPPAIGKHSRSDEPGDDRGSDTKRVAKGQLQSSHASTYQGTSGNEAEQPHFSHSSAKNSMEESNGNTVSIYLVGIRAYAF